jgi:hypothetical protein
MSVKEKIIKAPKDMRDGPSFTRHSEGAGRAYGFPIRVLKYFSVFLLTLFTFFTLNLQVAESADNPPADVSNLAVEECFARGLTLSWSVPSDDGSTGVPSSYDARFVDAVEYPTGFSFPWDSGDLQAAKEPTPTAGTAGQTEYFDLACAWNGSDNNTCSTADGEESLWPNTLYYAAMKSVDDFPNTSGISNTVSTHTAMKYEYNMIGIPYDIESASSTFNANFIDDVSPDAATAPVIYKWEPLGADISSSMWNGRWTSVSASAALNTETNGTGFYIYSGGYNNVLDVDTATVPEYTENWVGINLKQGRNLVGNPYLKNVDFSNIQICQNSSFSTAGGCSGGTIKSFESAVGTWVGGGIVNYVTNDFSPSIESCVPFDCTAQLRPWWGQWVYLTAESSSDTYILAIPRP